MTLAVQSEQFVTKRADRLCTISIFSCQCLALYKVPILLKSIPILNELGRRVYLQVSCFVSFFFSFLSFFFFSSSLVVVVLFSLFTI